MKIRFDKYHGCGNDFIIINNLDFNVNLTSEQIKKLCNRHMGIGADGLILIEKVHDNFFMNYFNADGSSAEMCGNGLRCSVDFIQKNINSDLKIFDIQCRDGLHRVNTFNDKIQVSVSKPVFNSDNIDLNLQTKINRSGLLSVGNPHLVIELDDFNKLSEEKCKKLSENYLKNGVNVNLVKVLNPTHIQVKTFERGDGFTLACGTGACASVSFLNRHNLCENKVSVSVPGGDLEVELKDNYILLSGPAEHIFQGEVEIIE